MKFKKLITVEIEAEPTSEEWFIEVYSKSLGDWIKTKSYPTFEEAFAEVPNAYKEIVKRAFAQKLEKKYRKSQHQFWGLTDLQDEDEPSVCIAHYYHFEMDYSTHIRF